MLALAPRDAETRFYFGDKQYIQSLQDIPLKGPNGEALFLGHMYRIKYFFAGVYLANEGYVLGIRGDRERFFRLPGAAQVARLQQEGAVSKKFPPNRLGMFDYLIGYSLWIALGILVPWGAISMMWRRRAVETTAQWSRMSGGPTRLPGAAP